jgi:hypothetical protein
VLVVSAFKQGDIRIIKTIVDLQFANLRDTNGCSEGKNGAWHFFLLLR